MNALNIDVCANKIKHNVMKLASDGSNGSGFYRADVIMCSGKEFKNYGGYPRNELAIINEQQSLEAAQVLCDKLIELPDDSKLPKDISDAELMLTMKSRYCQTPSEQIAHYERLLEMKENRLADKARKDQERKDLAEREKLIASLTDEEKEALEKKKREREVESLID